MDAAVSKIPATPPRAENPPCGAMESLPKWVICVPLVIQWFMLGLRHGSLTLPSAANPHITAGGLVGEGKVEYFAGGPRLQQALARFMTLRAAAGGGFGEDLPAALRKAGLAFPLIAKPDVGYCGYGVRRVDGLGELKQYLRDFPAGEQVVVQEYVPARHEAGIFYVREPDRAAGRITALALRHYPRVVGDGVRSVAALVRAQPRLARLGSAFHRADYDPRRVPQPGEEVRLATIGSTRVGGLYTDGGDCITPELTMAVDALAKDLPGFHFGRFDVRFEDFAEFRQGRGFRIIEINGAGSEAIQAWDPDVSLRDGFRMIFEKQALLFRVAAQCRKAGTRPIGKRALARLFFRQQRLIPRYPASN